MDCINQFHTGLTLGILRHTGERVVPVIGFFIAGDSHAVRGAGHCHRLFAGSVGIQLQDNILGTNVVVILAVVPINIGRHRNGIRILRDNHLRGHFLLIAVCTLNPAVFKRTFRDKCIQVRSHDQMIDGFQSIVIDRILEAVGIQFEHARPLTGWHGIDIIGTDGLRRHLDVLPLIRVVVPLIGHQRHGHELGPLTVPVILVIPDDRERNFVQLNGTGDRTAVVVANRTVAIRVNVRRRVAVQIERRGLIRILDGDRIINGFAVVVSLIILERVRPGIAVISNVAQCSRDLNFTRIRIMHRELAHRHTVGVQNQHHGLGADTVVVVVVIPVNRELDIIAGGNQRMIVRDNRIIFTSSCVIRCIVIYTVGIKRIHAPACIRQTGRCQLHGAFLSINLRSLNLMNLIPDIRITQEDNLICPLLQTGVIICDVLQVNLRRPCLSLGVTRYRNPLNDGIIIITIHQTQLNLCRTGAVIVQKIVPDNLNIVSTRQLTPLSVKVQRPVTTVRDNTGVFRVRLRRTRCAFMIHQQIAEIRCVQIFALGFRTSHTAAIERRIPVHILPANRIIQTCKQRQQVIIVVILGLQNTRAITCIIVSHDNTLSCPSGIICPPRLNSLFITFQRLRTLLIQVPTIECIAFTNRLFFQYRNDIASGNYLTLIHQLVSTRRFERTAVGVPISFIHFPDTIIRIKRTRVSRHQIT